MILKIALLQLFPGGSLMEQLNMLREYREHEVMGEKYRHPEKYGILVNGGK